MNLKKLRIENSKNQYEIAQLLNVANSTYNGYERETSEPNLETLKKLADYYNVSLDFLVGREWQNDFGYLNPEQTSAINLLKELNQINLIKAVAYMSGLLASQN